MESSELKQLIISRLRHVYVMDEAVAVANAYLQDKIISGRQIASFVINEDVMEAIESDITDLESGKPVQYVTGVQWFFKYPLMVNESVLIPRPETEEMVSLVISENDLNFKRIIDIGTGSGCIPVTLKLEFPMASIYATDISEKALKVAGKNAEKFGADITFRLDNIIETGIDVSEKFDIIISNPPYIPQDEMNSLEANVVKFEPAAALFAPSGEPLYFYKNIAEFAITRLAAGGRLYFEIHKGSGRAVRDLLSTKGFRDVRLLKDMSGNERFIIATNF